MAVSAEEQVRRANKVLTVGLAALLAIPILGDFIGFIVIVPKVLGMILLRSENRLIDLMILAGLVLLFFPISYYWIKVDVSSGFAFLMIYLTRFLIAIIGLPWVARRLE